MGRTSFLGALTAITLGGVLAFALQSSPGFLDLRAAGLIIMIAGIADLVIRFMISDSPLLGAQTADIAAVVEPVGEPVLDVFGNVIAPTDTLEMPALVVPAPVVPGVAPVAQVVPASPVAPVAPPVEAVREAVARDGSLHDQVVRQAGDYEQPASLTPTYALTGRPVRVGRRRRRRG